MAGNTPSQDRAIDPFSSYASDVVNKLSRNVTRNNNGLLAVSDFLVETDTTSPLDHVVVNPGFASVEDVLVEVTSTTRVDFRDSTFYVTPSGGIFDETGYYYVVLEYIYAKSRPAPTAKIKILRPSESSHSSLGTSLTFLAAVYVVAGVGSNEIDSIWDYDPTAITNKREYVSLNVSAEMFKPTHNPSRDIGRVIYVASRNKYWFGFDDRWEEISAGVSISIDTDSTALVAGMLAYVDANGNAQPSISTGGLNTRGEMVVLEVGTSLSGDGRARLAGVIDEVLVETGQTVGQGDVLYLSDAVAGTVTATRPSGSFQVLGKAMEAGSDVVPVKTLFFPGDVIFSAITGSIDPGDWLLDSTSGLYYYDVDITSLTLTVNSVIVNNWSAGFKIVPSAVEIRNSGTIVRISMPSAALTVDFTITDGAGGGSSTGGGGSSSHAILSNLDYASSGHTGFAPTPHGNGDHSSIFITAAGVTFENLDVNSDVGTGAAQVAQGDHSHSALSDIPTNETILFEKDTVVTGYTLLTNYDDMVVYITKGSSAGGESGGSLKSGGTWTQPNHTHTYNDGGHTHSVSRFGWGVDGVVSSPAQAHTAGKLIVGSGNVEITEGLESLNGAGLSQTSGSTAAAGTTNGNATANSWRPTGMNLTRQRRI